MFLITKSFGKTFYHFFSEKRKTTSKITLVENDTVSSEDKSVAEKLSDYFDDVVRTLQKNITDPVEKAIQEYDVHPSIIVMRSEIQNITLFEFCKISIEEMKNEINRLNPKKSSTHLNIPTKVLKLSLDTSAEYLTKIFNDSLTSCIFPDELKLADITPIFKKDDPTIPNNYRPISVLPVVSKLFERILQKQMYAYMNHFLSPYL